MKPIYATYLTDLKPIIWYGEALYTRYRQLASILKERLGEEYAYLLAEPSVSKEAMQGKDKALWFSDHLNNALPFNTLTPQQQQKAAARLSHMIKQIDGLAGELKNNERIQLRQLGESLQLALEIPSTDCIYIEQEKIGLVCWGFTSDQAQKRNFQLIKYLEDLIPPQPSPIPSKEPIETKPVIDMPPTLPSTEPPPPPAGPKQTRQRKFPWWWITILFLLLLLILLAIFLLKKPLLPSTPGLAPIDNSKIIPYPGDPLKREIVSNRLTVVLAAGSDLHQFVKDFSKKYPGHNIKFVGYEPELHLLQVEIPAQQQEEWKKRFEEFPLVKYTLYDTLLTHEYIPQDPGFKDTQANKFWGYLHVHVFGAWDMTMGNPDIVIAVIDSGFDLHHPELMGKSIKPWNIITRTAEVSAANPLMLHGTHVAATIAAASDNNQGISGICPKALIMPLRVGDDYGNIPSTNILEAILYAVHHKAHIVNLSIGSKMGLDFSLFTHEEKKQLLELSYHFNPKEAQFWEDIFHFASQKGLIVVQSAGNANIFADIDPMKRSPYTIIAAATDESNQKADFSNYGSKITLSAPGHNIYSAVPGGNYDFLSGTSMSAPIISGGIALLKSLAPDLTFNQIVAILKETGTPVLDATGTAPVGPLIQLDLALQRVKSTQRGQPCPCQDQIDELRRQIEALKQKLEGNRTEVPRSMVIPKESPPDFKFAEGRWKSSHDLLNDRTMKRIQLYVDISKDGKGRLTLVEENGTTCTADIALSFESNTLMIRQDQPAQCSDNTAYMPYTIQCRSQGNSAAVCTATPKSDPSKPIVHFNLVKEE